MSAKTWYLRLGYVNDKGLNELVKQGLIDKAHISPRFSIYPLGNHERIMVLYAISRRFVFSTALIDPGSSFSPSALVTFVWTNTALIFVRHSEKLPLPSNRSTSISLTPILDRTNQSARLWYQLLWKTPYRFEFSFRTRWLPAQETSSTSFVCEFEQEIKGTQSFLPWFDLEWPNPAFKINQLSTKMTLSHTPVQFSLTHSLLDLESFTNPFSWCSQCFSQLYMSTENYK